jgi:hypothetical protein
MSKPNRHGRAVHAFGTTTAVAASAKKQTLVQQAKRVLTKLSVADTARNGNAAVVAGSVFGGLTVAVALLALILLIVAMVKIPYGCKSLTPLGIAGIVTTFLFPPAGVVINSIGIHNPARFCGGV